MRSMVICLRDGRRVIVMRLVMGVNIRALAGIGMLFWRRRGSRVVWPGGDGIVFLARFLRGASYLRVGVESLRLVVVVVLFLWVISQVAVWLVAFVVACFYPFAVVLSFGVELSGDE